MWPILTVAGRESSPDVAVWPCAANSVWGYMRQTNLVAGRRWSRRPAFALRPQPGQPGSPRGSAAAAPTSLRLLIPGSGLLLLGVLYLWLASLPNYYMVPKLHPGRMGHWATVSLGFTLALVCGFGCYYAAWRIASQLAPTRRRIMLVFGVAAILSTVLAFTYPLLSDDMFYGIMGARTFSCYGQNPFATPPSRFPHDPFLPYAGWRDLTMPYGPLWVVISGLVAKISDRGLLATVLAFKALNVGVFLLTTGLLARLLAKRTPRTALAGLILWAWNPLVLVEVASSAHNDIVMISLIVAACTFAAARRPTPALLMLALAVAAKYVAILLVPFFALHFIHRHANWRAGIRALIPGVGLSLVALAALYVPFWVGFRTFGPLGEAQNYYGSVIAVARNLIPHGDGVLRDTLLRGGALLLYAICFVWLLCRIGRKLTDLFAASHAAILLLLLLWPFFMPWYTLWLVPIAALTGRPRLSRQIIVITGAALATYLFQFTLRQAFRQPIFVWSTLSAALVFGSLLLVTLAPLARNALRRMWRRLAPTQRPALGT